jgi:hypothetical protein
MVKLTRTEGETPPCVTETEKSSRSSLVISSQHGHNQPTVELFITSCRWINAIMSNKSARDPPCKLDAFRVWVLTEFSFIS